MGKVTVINSVTLDGVMQAPARPDEDTRGGFPHGGWGIPYQDSVIGNKMGELMASSKGSLLFGKRTYLDLYSVWAKATNNPYSPVLNRTHKYVASTTLKEPLIWENSTLLRGDAADAVAELKQQEDNNLGIIGSGKLIHSLVRRDLIDEYVLLITPIVLGTGLRLFPEGHTVRLRLVESLTSTTGVIFARYQAV
jgi:dihydrofolate reductase